MAMQKCDKYSRLELTIYIVSWGVAFCLPLLMQTYDVLSGHVPEFSGSEVLRSLRLLVPVFVIFLLNNFVLLPRLFWNSHKVWYFAVLVAIIVVMWWLNAPPQGHMHQHAHPGMSPGAPGLAPPPPIDMFRLTSIIIVICVLLANFGVKLYIKSLRSEVQMLNIQNENMLQELESLKYQISPHFLMNTLNNIQSLIETAPDTAVQTIQKLSKMMRYLLYENNTQSVMLADEVRFMHNFIELMKLRYPSSVKISTEFPENVDGISVPPLLFISFIENAFKYGVSYTEESMISVRLSVDGDRICFYCANFSRQSGEGDKKSGGIGLKNVKRRLELIYGNKYDLNITKEKGLYIVEMAIPKARVKEVIMFDEL
ncbi:MAG: histidine kinase [Muribaculaceae bacterium]|nr:histidine kinase [Muribaculaceae bacterium]